MMDPSTQKREIHKVDSFCETGEEKIILANHLDNSPMPMPTSLNLLTKLLETTLEAPNQTFSAPSLYYIGKYNQNSLLSTFSQMRKPVPASVDKKCPEVNRNGNATSLSRWVLKENEEDEDIIFFEGGEEERECRQTVDFKRIPVHKPRTVVAHVDQNKSICETPRQIFIPSFSYQSNSMDEIRLKLVFVSITKVHNAVASIMVELMSLCIWKLQKISEDYNDDLILSLIVCRVIKLTKYKITVTRFIERLCRQPVAQHTGCQFLSLVVKVSDKDAKLKIQFYLSCGFCKD
ncbi:hypothetical protein BpHYR1_023495 [Brachionus plicatilis]|uniref:Uncharacterized protein n=1 Tax=Brachionus plicatilis TaxID=10195 RepID=A0A3M7SE13_BRAPC|nr:hypothetical protein BpHYR1_023495 [Brachionus plicatilis]